MILNAAILKGYGLPIGDIPIQRIDGAILETEMAVLKPAIGDTNYIALYSEAGNWTNGGVVQDTEGNDCYVPGFYAAIAWMSYANLLRRNLVATAFGAVEKRDDHSDHVDVFEEARVYFNEGWQMLRDCCKAKGWKISNKTNYFIQTI